MRTAVICEPVRTPIGRYGGMFGSLTAVDLVVGPQNYHGLVDLVARAARGEARVVETEFPAVDKFARLPARSGKRSVAGFLTVQEGCDKFCTFCVVPYTRGAEYSRPVADIMAEAQRLIAGGTREIALLGQNVNAYHGAGPDGAAWTLGRLMEELAGIEGLARATEAFGRRIGAVAPAAEEEGS